MFLVYEPIECVRKKKLFLVLALRSEENADPNKTALGITC